MSISKTRFPFISALFFLTLLPACATHQAPLTALPTPTAPVQQIPPETVMEDTISFAASREEELTSPEPEITAAREVQELEALGYWEEGALEPEGAAGIPLTVNKQVEFYLRFFQQEQPQTFSRWLARSGRYLPIVEEQLHRSGLPVELAYLPMIESGYALTAYSQSGAMGPWQFMSGTARDFGLRVDHYLDERRDPVKSTEAAVKYLSRLYQELGNWHLVLAAYNAGEGRIRGAMRDAETDNFWKMSSFLPTETTRYVPKLIAAIMIAREPEKYGFADVARDEPLAFEEIEVPGLTPLQALAVAGGLRLEDLRELNRELRHSVTPPGGDYTLKVPSGKAESIARNLPRVRPVVTTTYKIHVVDGKDTLTKISNQYDLDRSTILEANNLRSAALTPGQRLRIPVRATSYELSIEEKAVAKQPASDSKGHLVHHTVSRGETISSIAKRYNTPAQLIIAWNNLRSANHIRAGQQLTLHLPKEGKTEEEEVVLEPRTFKLAAVESGSGGPQLSAASLPVSKNHLQTSRLTYYQVQGGDTLWDISRRFKISTEQIKRWNRLQDDVIHPGSRLLLRVEEDIEA